MIGFEIRGKEDVGLRYDVPMPKLHMNEVLIKIKYFPGFFVATLETFPSVNHWRGSAFGSPSQRADVGIGPYNPNMRMHPDSPEIHTEFVIPCCMTSPPRRTAEPPPLSGGLGCGPHTRCAADRIRPGVILPSRHTRRSGWRPWQALPSGRRRGRAAAGCRQ